MSVEMVFRLIGMILLAVVGWQLGDVLPQEIPQLSIPQLRFVLALFGGMIGLLVTPWVTIRPVLWVQREIRRLPIQSLFVATLGLIVGLAIAALLAVPLHWLPLSLGAIVPFFGAILFGYLGVMTALTRQKDILALLGTRFSKGRLPLSQRDDYVLLDTSVIIDGRIADVAQTGFVERTMLVPRFILNELQHIADSPDSLRRNRGRRGLDMLNKLQKSSKTPIEITDMDAEDVEEVDSKLIWLAKKLGCPVITNDYNLNRVAELQGVKVLNINELANAVKAIVLPGETIKVRIIQEGKELGQGVGYLDDGTMVVVENGRKYINNTMQVTVTRVLQTVAGRMIFATLNGSSSR
ncbi:MAG TPA: PIN domain nuclease [Anaerolineae bacterium]|nr:PIN domain nuclease [Anaerolineae bacterium]